MRNGLDIRIRIIYIRPNKSELVSPFDYYCSLGRKYGEDTYIHGQSCNHPG